MWRWRRAPSSRVMCIRLGNLAREATLQESLHVSRKYVRLEIHGVADLPKAECGDSLCMRNHGDRERPLVESSHCQADAVDGNRALVHHVLQHLGRGIEP